MQTQNIKSTLDIEKLKELARKVRQNEEEAKAIEELEKYNYLKQILEKNGEIKK